VRHARRTDANHRSIRDAWRAKPGWRVVDTSHIGNGFPDLVGAHHKHGVWLVEVKDGKKSPSKQRLTEAEAEMHGLLTAAGCRLLVVARVEDLP